MPRSFFEKLKILFAENQHPGIYLGKTESRKSVPLRSENLPRGGPSPWLDGPDAEETIARKVKTGTISKTEAQNLSQWHKEGYFILHNLFAPEYVNDVWRQREAYPHPRRMIGGNSFRYLKKLKEMIYDPRLLRWVELILGKPPLPYQ